MILSSVRLNHLSYTELDSNILHKLTIISSDNTFKIETFPYIQSTIESFPSEPPDVLLTEFESNSIFQNISTTFLSQL
ncbi:unnamed protein product, partial [Adineta steineri]